MAAYFDAPKKSEFLKKMQTPQDVYDVMKGRVAALDERFTAIARSMNELNTRAVHDERFGLLLENVAAQMFNRSAPAELNGAFWEICTPLPST